MINQVKHYCNKVEKGHRTNLVKTMHRDIHSKVNLAKITLVDHLVKVVELLN